MRRFRSVLVLAALALGALAPASASADELVVGLNMPAPGFQVGSVRGTEVLYAKGFSIDLANAIAAELGDTATFYQESSFVRLLEAGAKPWAFALAQVTITERRGERVDFSTPYMRADQGVLRKKGLTAKTRSLAALRPLRICTQKGTTSVNIVTTRIRPTRRPVQYANTTLLMERLRTGYCDVVVLDLPILATLRRQAPDRFGTLAGRIVTNERYGAVLEEGSPLKPQIDAAIRTLRANGQLATITKRWLAVDLARVPALS